MGQTFCRHLWSVHSRSEHINLWLIDKVVVVGDHWHLVYVSVTKWVTKRFVLLIVNTGAWILANWFSSSFRGLKYPDSTASLIYSFWIVFYTLSHSNPIWGGSCFLGWGPEDHPHWRKHTIRSKRTRHNTSSLKKYVLNTWRDGRQNFWSSRFYECILIVCLCMATLTEVFPCFFLSCKANVRVIRAKTGHGSQSSWFLCCSMYCLFCVVLCIVCV